MRLPSKDALLKVYGESTESSARFLRLAKSFKENFKEEKMEFFSAPGRTEIVGNHTDHNGGKVLAASIDLDTIGAAYPNGLDRIEIISEGYEDKIVVDIKNIDKIEKENGTLSLVAGMVAGMKAFGYKIGGFNAYVSTNVISAAGVSSSASFEMLLCAMMNHFFNEGKLSKIEYAKIGQYAENHYWNKASGLMDQMACAVGGAILLDFSDDVTYEPVTFGFEEYGYDLVIVNTGKNHADLSHEYSYVPMEMKAVAKALGVEKLSESSMENLLMNLPEVEKSVANDRALLRAIHFYEENRRVEEAKEAIAMNNGKHLLQVIEESGTSSWELLQNCYSVASVKDQKVALCLALTNLFLKNKGDGCTRVHGGGFAGVIMAIVPKDNSKEYVEYISKYVGKENVYPMKIRKDGAIHI